MADEIEEVEETPEIVLGDVEEDGDVVVNEGDTTIVVAVPEEEPEEEAEPDALDAVEVDALLTLTERVTRLEENQEAVAVQIAEARVEAVVAEVEAEAAAEEAEEAEEFEEEADDDEPRSAGAHPWFRGWRETFGRDR